MWTCPEIFFFKGYANIGQLCAATTNIREDQIVHVAQVLKHDAWTNIPNTMCIQNKFINSGNAVMASSRLMTL